jgi:hypothetical protein
LPSRALIGGVPARSSWWAPVALRHIKGGGGQRHTARESPAPQPPHRYNPNPSRSRGEAQQRREASPPAPSTPSASTRTRARVLDLDLDHRKRERLRPDCFEHPVLHHHGGHVGIRFCPRARRYCRAPLYLSQSLSLYPD